MLLQTLASKPLAVCSVQTRSLAAAEDLVARLDERLATSPIAAAFRARQHFHEATAAVFLESELVHLEDLVLHDAAADIRSPTHALTRAHAALRARRRIAAATPGWATSRAGMNELCGLVPAGDAAPPSPKHEDPMQAEEDAFARELAAVDALLARTTRVLEGQTVASTSAAKQLPNLIVFADRDRLAEWVAVLSCHAEESPVLAAAQAGAALDRLAPLPNQAWLARLLVGNALRQRGKTRHHLAALNLGMKIALRERKRGRADRLAIWIEAVAAAAQAGLSEHDRLLALYREFQRRLVGRRSTSRLPALAEMAIRSPVVSSQTIAAELKITPRAARELVAALGLRELTGRTRYQCWGVL